LETVSLRSTMESYSLHLSLLLRHRRCIVFLVDDAAVDVVVVVVVDAFVDAFVVVVVVVVAVVVVIVDVVADGVAVDDEVGGVDDAVTNNEKNASAFWKPPPLRLDFPPSPQPSKKHRSHRYSH